jgi:hypothetical protein
MVGFRLENFDCLNLLCDIIQRTASEHVREYLNVWCDHLFRVKGLCETRTAMFVASDNCRIEKVGHELIIGSLSNTSLPLLAGLLVCLQDLIDASVLAT